MRTGIRIVSPEETERQQYFMEEIKKLPQKPKSFFVVTYGCQMNAHDSEKLKGMLTKMEICEASAREDADLVVFNTCCVRENAERKALGNITWLKEIRKRNPSLIIAVCGCMIQEPGMAERILRQYSFVNLAFGTSNLYRFPEMLHNTLNTDRPIVDIENDDIIPEDLPVQRARSEFAYLTVMYGCNNFCSYCIVPYVRGRERSRLPDRILKEADELLHDGVKEIMLLGQNVNSYGKDLANGINFAGLLEKLDSMGIQRIRFMTSHPKDLSDELISAMADSKHILPQFHLPVQSGSNAVLRNMNRCYTREQYLDRVEKLRCSIPGIGLSTDIIVGFPGESDADFSETMQLIEQVRFDSAFTFVYSPRIGTKAASMPDQIDPEISTERIQKLISLQERLQQDTMRRFIGSEEEILVENLSKRSDLDVSGKGRHGISITVRGNKADIGSILKCRITGLKNNTLIAERID